MKVMQLTQNLYDLFYEKALSTKVTTLSIGLKYTAVLTDDGGMGIAYTYLDGSHCCPKPSDYRDYEKLPATELLQQIKAPSPLQRSMALALINALNYQHASQLPEDSDDFFWMDHFGVGDGTHIATVGFFGPLMKKFQDRGASVEVIDQSRQIGDKKVFYEKLDGWADILLLTSTSILNNTTEDVISHTASKVKVVMLGPSTPLVAEAFNHLPVQVLAGTVPDDQPSVLKAIRHGAGTPLIHRSSRKVYAISSND
jgi:hypothetical protein